MKPVVDHVQVTVRDLDAALPFYDGLMALLGFDLERRNDAVLEEHDMRVVEYLHPDLIFAISSPRAALEDEEVHRRRPGAVHHIAFRADSPAEVDRLAAGLEAIGAEIVGGPKLWPEHGPGYHAVFFKDPGGIKYEIVHHPGVE
jgi:catechol 2,3-dioxygenase-like lactoylglutathione lyase family enzyme